MNPLIALRRATMNDAETLLQLRNEPVAVSMSKTQLMVTREEHFAWLNDVFDERLPVIIFIITTSNIEIGFCRIAVEGYLSEIGLLSITLAPHMREHHFGWQALDLLIGECNLMKLKKLKATIKRSNIPSRRLFTRCGFTITNSPLAEWLEYERVL